MTDRDEELRSLKLELIQIEQVGRSVFVDWRARQQYRDQARMLRGQISNLQFRIEHGLPT